MLSLTYEQENGSGYVAHSVQFSESAEKGGNHDGLFHDMDTYYPAASLRYPQTSQN